MIQAYNSVSNLFGLQSTSAAQAANDNKAEKSVPAAAESGRSDSQNVSISAQGKGLAESDSVYEMNGNQPIDLDTYFDADGPMGPNSNLSLEEAAQFLLLPSKQNIDALQDHISKVFPEFLAANSIPEAPEKIRYDSAGGLVLPADYPYADQLTQALEDDPAMADELRTVNALSSHYAAIQQGEPFRAEYAMAKSKAEQIAVVDKYSWLFDDNRRMPEIDLSFSKDGKITVNADGTALS